MTISPSWPSRYRRAQRRELVQQWHIAEARRRSADGAFLTFYPLAELVQTYEGFQFDLKIVDSSDELE